MFAGGFLFPKIAHNRASVYTGDMQEVLKNEIIEVLKTLGLPVGLPFVVEHPADLAHGDYATNVALVFAKEAGKNPRELAGAIMEALVNREVHHVAAYEIAGPGFINVRLSPHFFAEEIARIIASTNTDGDTQWLSTMYGASDVHKGQKILVEHSSPNLFKPFHIGHMMNNAIGESLVRLMRASGGVVTTMTFPSDISIGLGKAIFLLLEKYGEDFEPTDVAVLGDAYVEGTKRFDEDETVHARIQEITDNLYAGTDSPELRLYNRCRALNIAYFEAITQKLGSHFDQYIFESEAGVVGKEIVVNNTPQVFTKSDGAIVYIPEEEKKNIHTAVFVNSQGNPTYEAKDLGLLSMKFDRVHPDVSLFVTDYQQAQHFDVVLDAAQKINSEWKEKSVHIQHGRMTFKGQKMSSRLGGVPMASDLIDVVAEEARERAGDRQTDAEAVAIAALKFAILRSKPGQNINFDPETSLSFEGDSGPYLQYTHARLSSLLSKAADEGMMPAHAPAFDDLADIHKIIYRFPEIVREAIVEYAPHTVAIYLLEVARAFNSYYGAHKIVDTNDREGTANRLALVRAVQILLNNGLHLLGIKAPETM